MKIITKNTQLHEIEIDAIKRELKALPAGCLVKRGPFYYLKTDKTQKGITKNKDKLMQLARKAYLSRRLRNLEWNYSLLTKNAERYKTEDPEEIIRELPSSYQALPINYFFHPSVKEQTEQLAKRNENQTPYRPELLIYLTRSGIRVRSKSERTIADLLCQNEIPYRYEAELSFGDSFITPDFTINRPYDGKLFLWEHLGLMDREEYRSHTNKKLALYNRYGYYPFENLICTYEHDLQNPSYLQAIIETLLLR